MVKRFPSAGTLIGGFRLERIIHSGGMATIWRVSRADIIFPLAMKIPHLTEGDDPAVILTFEVEQMILPRLSGPHVPQFVEVGDFTDQPYIVMECITGPTLRERFASVMFFPDEISKVGAKIATALHSIHMQHTIHLDVTPDNIMFRKNGDAVFVDFGLSRHDQLPDLMAEEFRLPMGTASYISPEQVLNMRSDPRSDIFSLGVILYQLATGELPFGDPTSQSGLRRRLYIDPVPPRALRKDCPNWLQEIILQCLEVDPANRYSSAAQLAFALENPEQVILTERAERAGYSRLRTMCKRWLMKTILLPKPALKIKMARHLNSVPIIMAAVDTSPDNESLAELLRDEVERILTIEKGARLTCVTVRKTPLVSIDTGLDEQGRNLQVQFLVKLKHWARPMNLSANRISFHVLAAPDPAVALLQYARANNVEHIVIGARGSSVYRRFLGSVSSHVVSTAPCTVTVVRVRETGDVIQGGAENGYESHG